MKNPASFSGKLLGWYGKSARDLPWRKTSDPYKIWISEIMLQQTTVNAVIPYYLRWVKEYPAVQHVARAPLQKILKSWQGLGYYSRARNIHKAAKLICSQYKSKIPSEPVLLRKIPGFGPYTTGAVLSIAFGQRQPIIDANVRRVVMRQLALSGFADPAQDKKIQKFLYRVMPYKSMGSFNQALMELGALVCKNTEVLCSVCPVKSSCLAFKRGTQEVIPSKKKKSIKEISVSVAIIKRQSKYLIQKRPAHGLFADLWEFPGGKVEAGESPREALRREIQEEVGVSMEDIRYLFQIKQFYTKFKANLHVFQGKVKSFPPLQDHQKLVSAGELSLYPMPSGSAKIVERLKNIS